MPIFKLKCRKCGIVFEYLFKNADEKVICGLCKSDDLEKLPSQIAVLSKSAPSCPNADSCPGASPCCCSGKCGGHK